jgi:hypothetical protein
LAPSERDLRQAEIVLFLSATNFRKKKKSRDENAKRGTSYRDWLDELERLEVGGVEVSRAIHGAHGARVRIEASTCRARVIRSRQFPRKKTTAAQMLGQRRPDSRGSTFRKRHARERVVDDESHSELSHAR